MNRRVTYREHCVKFEMMGLDNVGRILRFYQDFVHILSTCPFLRHLTVFQRLQVQYNNIMRKDLFRIVGLE